MKKLLIASGALSVQNPIPLNMAHYRGNSLEIEIKVNDLSSNRIFNFTEWDNARMHVKRSVADSLPSLVFDSAITPADFVLAESNITLKKTGSEMEAIVAGTYIYDLKLFKLTGEEFTILQGQFAISERITV
jgi:hypothetical protein